MIIHKKLFSNLHRFFEEVISIQSQTQVVDSFGDVASTWANRSGLNQIKARISGITDRQREMASHSGYIVTNQVLIPDYHGPVELADRIQSSGVNYEIREINHDSARSMTKLMVRRVDSPST